MRWERRVLPHAILLGGALLLVAPLIASLLGADILSAWAAWLGRSMERHRFREVTGYIGLTLILFELLLSLRKRTGLPIPGSFPGWRVVHMVTGAGLVLVIVIHTGGRWGVNLNGLLLAACIAAIFVGLGGKALEARKIERLTARAETGPARFNRLRALILEPLRHAGAVLRVGRASLAMGRSSAAIEVARAPWDGERPRISRQGERGVPLARLRAAWLYTHVVLVTSLIVLLGFHIFSVYYF
jgi:hypothetical protein